MSTDIERMVGVWEDVIIPEIMEGDYGYERNGTTRYTRGDRDVYVEMVNSSGGPWEKAYMRVMIPFDTGDLVFKIIVVDEDGVIRDWHEVARDFYQIIGPIITASPQTVKIDVVS